MYEKGMKTVSDSQVETIHQLRYIDINGQGRLFGGRLLEWIDETSALAAERHAGMNVTTASISHLDFKEGAYLNDTIVLVARVTYVGRTSIEVRCDTYLEDLETGMRHSINRAFLTEVCVDKEGHPTHINLIASGSIMSLMKRIFENENEPLYGRPTSKMTLRPFTIETIKQIFPNPP